MCVVHPMFFERLQTSLDQQIIIYPFPDASELGTEAPRA
jgi:hypothetical protein